MNVKSDKGASKDATLEERREDEAGVVVVGNMTDVTGHS